MAMRTVTGAALGPVMSRTISQDEREERPPATPIVDPRRRLPTSPTSSSLNNVKFSFPRPGTMATRRARDEDVEVGPTTPVAKALSLGSCDAVSTPVAAYGNGRAFEGDGEVKRPGMVASKEEGKGGEKEKERSTRRRGRSFTDLFRRNEVVVGAAREKESRDSVADEIC